MIKQFPWQTTRKVLTKKVSNHDNELDQPAQDILNYGIVNIDKPSGPSSHQVSAYVKQILKIDKTGHSGTLDPKVTGVLPIALGKGTRIVSSLLTAGKEYVCLMSLHDDLGQEKIEKAIMSFVGEIDQLPPVRSAVKRQVRQRRIYYIEIIEIEGRNVLFKVGCQAGTYIRKLCTDIGKKLGTGAHMAELRRTQAGPFDETTICTLQDLADAFHYFEKNNDDTKLKELVKPIEKGVEHLPKAWVHDSTVFTICHGASLNIPGISKIEEGIEKGDIVAIFTLGNELVCTVIAHTNSQDVLNKEKGLFGKLVQVFMAPDRYPKI